mmetsp:Transcript_18873/g.44343  ORF Transcript_18873/g.44343 Transcript_18873/m.44343 type:complete len:215 (-) Transcript_18873:335-979(-)
MVCAVYLLHQPLCSQPFLDLLLHFFGLQGLNLLEDKGALLVPLLFRPHPLRLPVLDLLNDDPGTAALALQSLLLADLVHFQRLEPLDLHHRIELALLLLLLGLNVPLLLNLGITDGDNLRVEHHLVHVLHVVHVLVQHLLGPLQHAVLLRAVGLLASVDQHRVLLALLLHLPDLLLPGDGLGHALCVGLLLPLLLLHLLLLGQKPRIVTQPVQL